MKLYGRLAWSKLCACRDCGNVPKDPRIYQLRRKKWRALEKRQWMREGMMET